MFITYLIMDPRVESFPIYAGKGRPNRIEGVKHLLEGKTNIYAGKRVNNWLKGMRNQGFRDLPIVTFNHANEADAFKHEAELTHKYGIVSEGGQLLNSRHGGDGGWSLSPEQRKHLSNINNGSGNSNYGTTWSDARRAKWQKTLRDKQAKGLTKRSSDIMMKTWSSVRRTYLITSPNGHSNVVEDLTKWCNENRYPLTAFRKALSAGGFVVSGSRKSRVEGWQISYS